jgi:hypothetical protein
MKYVQSAFLLSCLAALAATLGAQRLGPKPVGTILQLHEAMINPSSDAIFEVGREAPADEAAWKVLRNHAVILAESGNLLMLDGRAKDTGDWFRMSVELMDSAASALRAADQKNVDGVLAAGDRIAAICEACHEPYRDGGRKMGPPAR